MPQITKHDVTNISLNDTGQVSVIHNDQERSIAFTMWVSVNMSRELASAVCYLSICIWNEWISDFDLKTFYVNGDFSIIWSIFIYTTVKTAPYDVSDLKHSLDRGN